MEDLIVKELNCDCRSYEAVVKLKASLKNRYHATMPDAVIENVPVIKAFESAAGKLSRQIGKHLEHFDIWNEWLKGVPGIGPAIAGNLIILYYFRFVSICEKCGGDLGKRELLLDENGYEISKLDKKTDVKVNIFTCSKCGKKAKGEGVLKHRIEEKDFPNVSKWWAYLGRDIRDGKMRKRAKGVPCNWSTKGRTLGFQIADQFTRQTDGTPYGQFLLSMKAKHLKKNDDREKPWTKGHIHNAGRNEAVKLFLSHFWHVARSIAGKSTEGPWIEVIAGHTGIIAPYYWDAENDMAA